jgi:hypothetical protein
VGDVTSVELAIQETPEIQLPLTGEIVDLRQPEQVAVALHSVREAKRILDQARQLLEEVLVHHSQKAGTKTLHLDHVTAEISGGSRTDYDLDTLRNGLTRAGLPQDRLGQLIVETITYRVNASVAKSVEAANPAYAAVIERARITQPAPWRVTIKHQPARRQPMLQETTEPTPQPEPEPTEPDPDNGDDTDDA